MIVLVVIMVLEDITGVVVLLGSYNTIAVATMIELLPESDSSSCSPTNIYVLPFLVCPCVLDLAFLLDGSGSITQQGFTYIKEFVGNLTDYFAVSPEGKICVLIRNKDDKMVI